jgi:hypothetical protein
MGILSFDSRTERDRQLGTGLRPIALRIIKTHDFAAKPVTPWRIMQ